MRVRKGWYLNFQLPILPTRSLKGDDGNDASVSQLSGWRWSSGRPLPRTENRTVCTGVGLASTCSEPEMP